MRRIILAVALAGGALAGLVGSGSPSGAAVGVVDFGTTVVSDPGAVSPAGESVRYVVTYSNTGAVAWTGTATNATTGGGVFEGVNGDATGCTLPSIGAVNPIITCDLSLAAGATKSFGVLVATPANADDVTNTTAVVADLDLLGVLPDDNAANDNAAVTTVVTPATAGASAYLRPGESLQWRNHTLTAVEAYGVGGGVVATLKDSAVGPGAACGSSPCSTEGLNYDFFGGNSGQPYEGKVAIRVDFTVDQPCYGFGTEKCNALFYRLPDPLTGAIDPNADGTLVAGCADASRDPKAPCLVRFEKVGNAFVWYVEALTNDPDLLGGISGVKL